MNAIPNSPSSGMPSLGLPPGLVIEPTPQAKAPLLSRNASIGLAVVGLHIAFIWALQSGLLMRAAEIIIPAEVLTQFIEPPAPKVEPVPPKPPEPVKKQVVKTAVPPPMPLAVADPTPAPNAPVGVVTPTPAPPAPVAPAPPAPAAAPSMQLPSSDASYLQNPKPPYPPMSRRLNEQGKSIIRVLIGIDGQPQKADIAKSSGYDRLDQAAMATVMRWRYVPGKRNGVPEEMWFNVPINWVLE
ncbi:MAG: energy transducer TonB [Pseudomonadota bacterium]